MRQHKWVHILFAGKQEGRSEQALGSRVVKDVSQDILGKEYHLFLIIIFLAMHLHVNF